MQNVVQFFKEISPAKFAASVAALLAFFILLIFFLLRINEDEMVLLYTDLDIHDSAKIAEELDAKKAHYNVLSDGSAIKVRKSEVANLRLSLVQVGLPTSGSVVGYEIFDKEDSIGATNFSQNIKLIRALEGELSRTISAFDQISKARVHLVIPHREIFSKEKAEPRASIILKFHGNKRLSRSEIDSIGYLVVTSVPNLEMKNVTIVDTKGAALKIGSSEDGVEFASGKNEEIRLTAENRLKSVIENILANTVGAGKIKAQVALEMNFDRVITNSELYDPDGSVVRSTQSIDEREQNPVSGGGSGSDTSVANNIQGGGAGNSTGSAITEKSDQTTNYEISKTVKNHIAESGVITKMSVGILIDGIYNTDPSTGGENYTERSKEEINKIINLIKMAVGFNEDRGDKIEVINMKFASASNSFVENEPNWIQEELPNLLQSVIFGIIILLVLVTVIRPIAIKAFEMKQSTSGVSSSNTMLDTSTSGQNQNDSDSLQANAQEPSSNKSQNAIAKMNQSANSNPQDIVNVLRKWLNEKK